MGRPKGSSDLHFWEGFTQWLHEVTDTEKFKLKGAATNSLKTHNNKAIAQAIENVLNTYDPETYNGNQPPTDRPTYIKPEHIYDWFNGKRKPRLQLLPILAEALRHENQNKVEAIFQLYQRLGLLDENSHQTIIELMEENARLSERKRKEQRDLRNLQVRKYAIAAALELQTLTDAVLRSRTYAMTIWPAHEGPMEENYRMTVAHRLDFKRLDRQDFAPRELREHELMGPALENSRAIASERRPRWYLTIKNHVNYFDLPYTGLTRIIPPHKLKEPPFQRILIYSLTSQGWVDEIGDFLGRLLGLPFTSTRYQTYLQEKEQTSGNRMDYMRRYLQDKARKNRDKNTSNAPQKGKIVSYYGDLDPEMEEHVREQFDMVIWMDEDDNIMHHIALKKRDDSHDPQEAHKEQITTEGQRLKEKLIASRNRYKADTTLLNKNTHPMPVEILPRYHKNKHGEAVANVTARWERVFKTVFEITRILEGNNYGALCNPFIRATKTMPAEEQNTRIFALWLAEQIITEVTDPSTNLTQDQRKEEQRQLNNILSQLCTTDITDWFSTDPQAREKALTALRSQADTIFRADP
ncbi:MAG: hypothetical protein SPI83_08785 [Rothia sp. (in: high G+C Gram-positive bacteria)]|nr:hypothetical protein [Rothia sp. (in: high G+C Gram-positive bacteria)]